MQWVVCCALMCKTSRHMGDETHTLCMGLSDPINLCALLHNRWS